MPKTEETTDTAIPTTAHAIHLDVCSTRRERFASDGAKIAHAAMFCAAVWGTEDIPADARAWRVRTRHLTDHALDIQGSVADAIQAYRSVLIDYWRLCRQIERWVRRRRG